MRPGPQRAVSRLLSELAGRRSVVVCYHGIGPRRTATDPLFLRVPRDRFRTQIELLLDAGFQLVTVRDLARAADNGAPPPGLASLSFDDGWGDNRDVVLPLLQEMGIQATFYITTGLIGRPNPWLPAGSGARMMTGPELRDLVAAGMELGAHTVSHPDLSTLDRSACLREMTESRAELQRLTGATVDTFAYPFCRYGPAALEAAAEAGFLCSVTCEGRGSWDRHEVKRALITGKDGQVSFVLKLADAYHPLVDSAAGRVVRRSTRHVRAQARLAFETVSQ